MDIGKGNNQVFGNLQNKIVNQSTPVPVLFYNWPGMQSKNFLFDYILINVELNKMPKE